MQNTPQQTEYRTVLLAAFLHDIGKLLGRGSFQAIDKGQHPKFSSDFISSFPDVFPAVSDADLLKELVQKHHENSRAFPPEYLVQSIQDPRRRTLATLISLADNLSSSERSDSSDRYQDYKTTPLASVIQRLDNPEDIDINLNFQALPLPATASLELGKTLFPSEKGKYQAGEMNSLIRAFGSAFQQYTLSLKNQVSYEPFLQHLNSLVYAHTWCIPSNTQEAVPDISLFDHLKTTAAIAACLYQYHQKTGSLAEDKIKNTPAPRFMIAAGDISGIQNYLFDIPVAATKGAARRLRARSLFIQLCSEVAAHQIIHRLDLPPWNIIISSGGNFYILLPNLPETGQALEEIQAGLDRWLVDNRNGELALNLAWQSFGDAGFQTGSSGKGSGFSTVIQNVKDLLNQKKQNRFKTCLQGSAQWLSSSFILPVDFGGAPACDLCKKYPVETGTEFCSRCAGEIATGSRLPGAGYISFYRESRPGLLNIFGYSVDISRNLPEAGNPYLILKLNDPDLKEAGPYPASFKYLATHVPSEDDRTLTFEQIAAAADGQKLLGFLKADVDNLGRMLAFGLKRQDNSLDTISRQTTFSRLMDTFFTGYIEALVKDEYADCYTVYSGGDDFFFVGPWDKVLALAEQINLDFTRFAGNRGLTLSAGLSITRPDYPVARAADLADQALKLSKDNSKENGRNRLTLLETTLTWEEWAEIKKEWLHLQSLVDKNTTGVPSAFTYNLLKLASMWKQYRQGETRGLRFHPLLAYNIRRNLDQRRMPDLYRWAERLLVWPPGQAEARILDYLGLMVTLCLYSMRGRR